MSLKLKIKLVPKLLTMSGVRQYGWKIDRAGQQTRPGQADTPIVKGMFLYLNILDDLKEV